MIKRFIKNKYKDDVNYDIPEKFTINIIFSNPYI